MDNDPNNKIPYNKKMKMVLRLFPYLKNKELCSKLLIDDDSVHYISIREYAEKISDIIRIHTEMLNIKKEDIVITDTTAGVGGDTISFSKNFKHVYSIEIDKVRSEYLENNIDVYECTNITIFNDDCLNIVNTIEDHNVIFCDPPWGLDYKKYTNLRLSLGDLSIESLCLKLMDLNYMKKVPEIIVLKLPKNYDIVHFYKSLPNHNMYYYDLRKMLILVIMINKVN
jgi:16S rRNA G966 N2-methylase RsmD